MKPRRRAAIPLIVASDNRLFRECLAERIARDRRFRVVGSASAEELPTQIRRTRAELLLFDRDDLGAASESLLVRLRSQHPALRILVLAADTRDASAARILRYGASGVVSKKETVAGLFRALAAVGAGETWAPSRAVAQALSHILFERKRGASAALTARERQILALLGEGYRNKELAALLAIKEQTVKIHLHSVFRKLRVRSRVEAALKAARG
ncbi:MAG TPA: response regulator transcription factor [Thermoanaerobaculia bacterium]